MGVADLDARLLASIYRKFGVSARWAPSTGSPVEGIRVRRVTDEDTAVEFGVNSQAIVDRVVLHVRLAEVASVTRDGRFEILDAQGAIIASYVVTNRARKVNFDQEWRAEVEAVG
jgi:hypothetical protein